MSKKMHRLIAFCLILISVFSLFTGCGDKGKDKTDITPEKPLEEQNTAISYKAFEKADFFYLTSLQIPETWYYEETSNGFALIEKRTGAEIDFIIDDYAPAINNITVDVAKQQLTSDTKSFVSFQKTAGNQLFYKYYWTINGARHAVCETQKFNFKYIYTLRLICEERDYEKFFPIYDDVVKSLKMKADIKTIPDGYNGLYFEKFRILTTYPRDWKTTADSTYYTSSYSKSSITFTFANPIPNFAGMDKTTYNETMKKTVQNFSTSAFVMQNGVVVAEGYYTADSVRYVVYNTIYNFKEFSLNIIYVAPENEAATFRNVYASMVENLYPQ